MANNSEDISTQESSLRNDKIAWLLREGALKEWSVTLSAYLEHFHNYTVSSKDVNFTEVAMLLQNTTSCYSKRVDNVHKSLIAFVDSLISDKTGNQSGNGGASGGSKGKSGKSLIRDNLEVLDFVASETSTRMDLNKYMSTQEPVKTIVFPPPQITSRKPGLTRTLFDVDGKVIGTKDDFGLFGKMSSSGYFGDLDSSTFPEESGSESAEDISNGVIGQNDDVDTVSILRAGSSLKAMDVENYDMVSELQPSIEENDNILDDDFAPQNVIQSDSFGETPPSPLQNTTEPGESETQVERCNATKKIKKQKATWEPIGASESKICAPKPIKVCNTLNATELVASSSQYKAREVICGRRRLRRINSSSNYECLGYPSFVQWAAAKKFKTLDSEKFAVMQEKKNKKKLFQKMLPKDEKLPVEEEEEEALSDDFDDGNPVFDDDNNSESPDMDNVQPSETVQPSEDGNTVDFVPTTYEEDAIAVIQKFQEKRQAFAANAVEITKRVDQWHKKIRPVLEEAETRSTYDSHEYGTRVLKNLTEKNDTDFVPFGNVIGKQPNRGEVARYFLSTLMLANTYNIEIKNDPGSDQTDGLKIKLLSESRHHEQMGEALRDL